MTAIRTAQPAVDTEPGPNSLLLVRGGPTRGLTLLPIRRRDAVIARLRFRSLDRRLAAGESAHGGRLLAVRAAQLVSTPSRLRLAGLWDQLAIRARLVTARDARRGVSVPGRTDLEVVDGIESVAAALRADRLVLAHGVALAATMTGAAAEAIDRLHSGGEDVLAAVVRAAVAAMGRPVSPR